VSPGRGRRLAVVCLATMAGLAAAAPAHAAAPIGLPAAAVPAKLRDLVRARAHMKIAKPHRRSWETRFKIETKDGYRLVVVGARGVVAIVVTRGSGSRTTRRGSSRGFALTGYAAKGTVTSRRVKASFGRFGRIAVRFRPSGRVVKSPRRRRCKGPHRYTIRHGVFVGKIRFAGENHYVQVRAHRAKGRIRRPLRLRCSRSRRPLRASARQRRAGGSPAFSYGTLQAGWREALTSTEFLALRFGKRALYLASSEESLGAVAEVRYAMATGPSRTFVMNEALTSARLRPPWPFRGAGAYAASTDGVRTWSGDLRASFPGAPGFPLAGSGFRVKLESSF
jgi:hypothetical protein